MINNNRREYLRNYQREWVAKRRAKWIKEHGPCAKCGSWCKLEVDHCDPTKKLYESASIWSLSAAKAEVELAKCQVLCHDCHAAKSSQERELRGHSEAMRLRGAEGTAWCSVGHFTEITNFNINRSKWRGLNSDCKICRRALRTGGKTRTELRAKF